MSPALRAEVVQEDWSAGMSRDIAPALIPSNGAYDLVNALLDEDGNPYRRGGTSYYQQDGSAGLLDAFDRADEDPVGNGKWIGPLGPDDADLRVADEQLVGKGSAVYDLSASDVEAAVTIVAEPVFSLWVRIANEGTSSYSGYRLRIAKTSVSVGGHLVTRWEWTLRRHGGGTDTLLASATKAVGEGDQVALRAAGSSLSAWLTPAGSEEPAVVLSATDTAYSSGRIGVANESGSSILDDFSGGSLAAVFSTTGLTWLWDGYLGPGERTLFADASNFGALDSGRMPVNLGGPGLSLPKQSAVLDDLLFIGGGSIYGGSRSTTAYSAGTITVANGSKVVTGVETSWSANVDAGMLLKIGSERVYAVEAVSSDTELTLRDAYQGSGGGGKSYTLSPLYTMGSDPYQVADFMTVCANRVVLLIGRRILFTEVDDPHTFTNSFGTANEHTLPEGVEGVGLATVGETVLAFTTGGVWTLDGLALSIVDQNGNAQHRLQQFSADLVLADAPGLAGSGARLVVPTTDGIFLMDGISSPERISRPIDRLYRARIAASYRLGKAAVYRGHYFLPILDGSGNVRDLFVCRLDAPFRSRGSTNFPWTRFTGDGGEVTAFAVRSSVEAREPLLLGAQAREPSHVLDCSPYFEPDAAHRVDADGTAHAFQKISRDIGTGDDTENVIRSVEISYDLIGGDSSEPVGLRGEWSDGSYVGGEAEWDAVNWDGFDWAAEEEGVVFNLMPQEGVAGNPARQKFRVNKRLRYGRFRISTRGAPAFFALRQMKMDVRPSKAVRR